ncbi:hypothetical protein Tco_0762321 [Tanacetum coccineum]
MAQEHQQQTRADEELVPITDQVKIGLSNFRIVLEKQKLELIYQLCLDILKQFYFFNAFTGTAYKKKEIIRVPRKKRSKTIVEETDQTDVLVDSLSLEETEVNEEEHCLTEIHTSLVIGREVNKETDERTLDYPTMKLKEVVNVPSEGSSVVPETPDEQSDSSGSSHSGSDDEEGFVTIDDEETKETSDNERTETDPEKEKPTVPPPSPIHTLSSIEYDNQFLNDNVDISMNDILQDLVETKTQSMVDVPVQEENLVVQETQLVDVAVSPTPAKTTQSPKSKSSQSKTKIILKKPLKPEKKVDAETVLKRLMKIEKKVDAMSKVDHTATIDKLVQAHLKNVLPKVVPYFGKIKQEHAAKKNIPKSSKIAFDSNSRKEYDLKNELMSLMMKSKSFKTHPTHKQLYDALMESLLDPPIDNDKDMHKRRREDTDASLSKKDKDQTESSKKDKDPSATSKTKKVMDAEESIQADDVVDAKELTQDDVAPRKGNSQWFKQDAVERPETPEPCWFKEPNMNDAPEQGWFNKMVNVEKDPGEFGNQIGSIVNFKKYVKNYLKKDKITKADLEGPAFALLKGPSGKKTIPLDYFFNKDLEYLKYGNKENQYAISLTKQKVARYELEGIEEMIPQLWCSSKVAYDKNVALGIHHWGPKHQLYYRLKNAVTSAHKEIVIRRAYQKEYMFSEANFPRLHLNDIEDLTVIKKRVEDVQLGVESYQTKLNLTIPQTRCDGLKFKEPYTIVYKPRGVVYLNKNNRKILMRVDELHKFSAGTLKLVHENMDLMLHNFVLRYNSQGMPNRAWSGKDQKRTTLILKKYRQDLERKMKH